MTKYSAARRSSGASWPVAMYWSMATFIRYGCASCDAAPTMMAANDTAT
jgi:hypothetical protein